MRLGGGLSRVWSGDLRFAAARLLACLLFQRTPLGEFGFRFGAFLRGLFLGFLFQFRLGLLQLLQAAFAPR